MYRQIKTLLESSDDIKSLCDNESHYINKHMLLKGHNEQTVKNVVKFHKEMYKRAISLNLDNYELKFTGLFGYDGNNIFDFNEPNFDKYKKCDIVIILLCCMYGVYTDNEGRLREWKHISTNKNKKFTVSLSICDEDKTYVINRIGNKNGIESKFIIMDTIEQNIIEEHNKNVNKHIKEYFGNHNEFIKCDLFMQQYSMFRDMEPAYRHITVLKFCRNESKNELDFLQRNIRSVICNINIIKEKYDMEDGPYDVIIEEIEKIITDTKKEIIDIQHKLDDLHNKYNKRKPLMISSELSIYNVKTDIDANITIKLLKKNVETFDTEHHIILLESFKKKYIENKKFYEKNSSDMSKYAHKNSSLEIKFDDNDLELFKKYISELEYLQSRKEICILYNTLIHWSQLPRKIMDAHNSDKSYLYISTKERFDELYNDIANYDY